MWPACCSTIKRAEKRAERDSFEQRDSIAGELSMSKIVAGTELSQKVLMMGLNEALDRYASH